MTAVRSPNGKKAITMFYTENANRSSGIAFGLNGNVSKILPLSGFASEDEMFADWMLVIDAFLEETNTRENISVTKEDFGQALEAFFADMGWSDRQFNIK